MVALKSDNVRHVGGLDIPGGGQVMVRSGIAYVGHMKPPHGTSIIDVSDPKTPKLIAEIDVGSRWSHTHKVRVAGDYMITNVEQDRRHFIRRGARIPDVEKRLTSVHGRKPTAEEVADDMGVSVTDLAEMRAAVARGYDEGGFKLWDISNPAQPKLLNYVRTHGFGVHRFDMDERYAYISTEMDGYVGNILVIYDLADPERVSEVSRWWLPGQHVAGGETPTWTGYGHRLHHAMRVGNELWAAVWHAGIRVVDISDITAPKTIGAYNYHPWVVEPTHTVMPTAKQFDGRTIALACDEEHEHRHGQPHAGLWVFDASDRTQITPLSTFHVSEMDSPWSRSEGRFGMHQFQEHIDDDKVFCAWFSGGLRVVDISVPEEPREDAFFMPEPRSGFGSPQTNDVDVDDRGLVYLIDRNRGFDIVEYKA
ncbi:MAG: RNA polymerase subunit sigma-70 [Pseudomonadota bacterium]